MRCPSKSLLYSLSILVAAMTVRFLVALHHPDLDLAGTIACGAVTVTLLAPLLYRLIHGEDLFQGLGQERRYLALTGMSVLGFGYFVLLT